MMIFIQGKMHCSDEEEVEVDYTDLSKEVADSINAYQNICTQRSLVDKSYSFNINDLVRVVRYFGIGDLDIECLYQAVKDDDVEFDLEHYNYVEAKKLLKILRKAFKNDKTQPSQL